MGWPDFFVRRWDSKGRPCRRQGNKVSGGHFVSPWESPSDFRLIRYGCGGNLNMSNSEKTLVWQRFLKNPIRTLAPLKKDPHQPTWIFWRRVWDSNSRWVSPSPVFKTGSLNRSDNSPYGLNYSIRAGKCQGFLYLKHFDPWQSCTGMLEYFGNQILFLWFGVIPKRPKGLPC